MRLDGREPNEVRPCGSAECVFRLADLTGIVDRRAAVQLALDLPEMPRNHDEVHIGNEIVEISLPGKWHEQTGPRAQFAPAFTYFNIQNQDTALLAIHYPELGRTAGYLREGEQITGIKNLSISPPEHSERQFELLLEDQRQISGVANVTRRWSVPIEGQRRPGSTVVVDSSLGKLVGALNDWRPAND